MLIPVLIDAVNEQQATVEDQRKRIDALETGTESTREENEKLRVRNAELEDRLAAVERHLGLDGSSPVTADD